MVTHRICIMPRFGGPDKGEGGIRRVVEAQLRHLPTFGWESVENPGQAEVVATHAVDTHRSFVGEKVVTHNHGLYWSDYQWEPWHYSANEQVIAALSRSDVITAPSNWVAQILRRGFLRRCEVLYHGVELSEHPWPPQAHEGYVLWNKTRVDPVCDAQPLVELARRASTTKFVTTFAFGQGNGSAQLPPANVATTGTLSHAQALRYVRGAAVYLCTTRETFGIGTIEAMASGVPVLGWSWGGQREIVVHGETGWLCRPGDYEGLQEGLEYCLANRDRLSVAARDHVAGSFTWERAISRYADLYTQLLEGAYSPGLHSYGESRARGTPRATILITCYKLERFLERAIRSCKALFEAGCEVLVVDDCSPGDGSGQSAQELCEHYGVHYERTPENLYLAGALNFGVEHAAGPIIIPLDADNELGPGMMVLIEALEKDRGIDIAYGAVQFNETDGAGNDTGRAFVSKWPGEFNFREQLIGHNQIPSTSAYRRTVWERVGGYRQRCRTAEDADFWCRASSFGGRPQRVTDAVTFIYHDRSDSMSHVEADWPWAKWYSWGTDRRYTPMSAAVSMDPNVEKDARVVPTFEPTLISVVVPVGPGHGRYLPDAIDSLLSQTFRKWELILVNDSGKPLPWVPPFAKLITVRGASKRAVAKRSPAIARNQGLAAASVDAKAFLLLDADDYLQPNALEVLWASFDGGVIYGDFIKQPSGEVEACPEFECSFALQSMPIPITFLGPMWAIHEGLKFDATMDGWEDWDFLLNLVNMGACGMRVPHSIFNYRYHTGSRREELYARRQGEPGWDATTGTYAPGSLKGEMFNKWREYIQGEKQLMACGGCRGGGFAPRNQSYQSNGIMSFPPSIEPLAVEGVGGAMSDHVLLEYIGTSIGSVTYAGPVTRREYRFGAGAAHKVRLVHMDDARAFVELRPGEFKLFQQAVVGTPLMAPAG